MAVTSAEFPPSMAPLISAFPFWITAVSSFVCVSKFAVDL